MRRISNVYGDHIPKAHSGQEEKDRLLTEDTGRRPAVIAAMIAMISGRGVGGIGISVGVAESTASVAGKDYHDGGAIAIISLMKLK
mmetsp:Transcript_29876/g.63364  ORF Transcript_29876/g.63364 Transcript_29876/m.63364 type:complete len:86 (+) Transcript_29876:1633-1890(+)